MDTAMELTERRAADIRAGWARLKEETPGMRARDAAAYLGISEGELVAARTGDGIVRLDPGHDAAGWGAVIRELPTVGEVMCLTRNEHAVHEKYGTFDKVNVGPGHGLVLDPEIDLRLFLNHWHHGFAVRERVKSGIRDSLQFFDIDGTAVHKVFLTGQSDTDAHTRLVTRFTAADQTPGIRPLPLPTRRPDRPDAEIDRIGFRAHWERLQDTHDFFPMLRDFEIGRHQAMRLIGRDLAHEVAMDSLERALILAGERAVPIMVFVGNRGCIQIHTGPVQRIEAMGPWINVLDPRFNLHVRQDQVGSAWIVRKPTRDGIVTSLELFDRMNEPFLQMFGERKPGTPELESWRALTDDLSKLEAAA